MDLAIGAKQIFVTTLFDKECRVKLVPSRSYPLTGVGSVSRVYTDNATFDLTPDSVVVTATFGTAVEELRTRALAFTCSRTEGERACR